MGEEIAMFWTVERLAGVAAFAFAGTWTPGPNNMMLANSGATFGFRRSLPHILGVALGFAAMAFAVALGLGEAFQASSTLREALRWGGAALLLYLAWRVATAAGPEPDPTPSSDRLGRDGRADALALGGRGTRGAPEAVGRPLSFLEACAFQWINPKAWSLAAGVAAGFMTGGATEAAAIGGIFLLSGLTSAHAWASFGAALRGWLGEGARLRLFNRLMGAALALFVVALILD